MAFRTSRTFTSRRRPPRLAGGIIGSINPHSASVRSLGYRSPVRAANRRCSAVHMWCPLKSSAPHIESQPIPLTQQLCGSALRPILLAIADVPDPMEGMKYVLQLVVRRIVVGNLGTGNVERRFGEAAKKVSEAHEWTLLREDLKDL